MIIKSMKLNKCTLMMLLLSLTRAHMPIDCFEKSVLVGDSRSVDDIQLVGGTLVETSDLELIERLGPDHELTSVKVCTDRAVTYIRGTQVTYGIFDAAGEIVKAVSLYPYGEVDQATSVCTNFYIPKDDFLSTILIRYNANVISQLWLTSRNGISASYGVAYENDAYVVGQFSRESYFFYGFQGRVRLKEGDANHHLEALGLVKYDFTCLRDEKARLINDFSWGVES